VGIEKGGGWQQKSADFIGWPEEEKDKEQRKQIGWEFEWEAEAAKSSSSRSHLPMASHSFQSAAERRKEQHKNKQSLWELVPPLLFFCLQQGPTATGHASSFPILQ
jgi:hypothetical protein